MKRNILLGCLVLLFGLSVPAIAQSNRLNEYGGGSRLIPRAAQIIQSGPNAAAIVLQNFGECIVARRVSSTEQLLALPISATAYEKGFRRLFSSVGDSCLEGDGTLEFSDSLLRGSLFQALYRKKFARADIPSTGFNLGTDSGSDYVPPWSEVVRQHLVLQQFSHCVTQASANDVRKLVLSSPGSSLEEAAVVALSPKFSSCFSVGTSLKMTKPALRAMLAEALYRVSVRAVTGAAK